MTGGREAGAPLPDEPAVLLIGTAWNARGGLSRYLRGLHGALRRRGLRVSAVVFDVASDPERGLVGAGPEDAALPARLKGQAASVRTATAEATVVDVHMALYGVWPLLSGGLRRRPLVVHFHGPWAAESAAESGGRIRLRWLVEWLVYRRALRLVTLSSAFKRVLVEQYRIAPWKVRVVPPGVDLDRFTPDRVNARRALGIDDNTMMVFCARRLVQRVGVDVLIDAWGLLERNKPADGARRLMIAGSGPENARLEALIAAHGLGGQVSLLGAVTDDELVRHYQAADLCVVPSRSLEGFGLVILEALACGTPVVVTDVGGLPEVVNGLDPSLIVAPERPDALAARLASAFDLHDLPTAGACRTYAERFTWSAAALAHEEMYAEAAEATDRSDLRVVYLDHCARMSGAEIAMARLLPYLEGIDRHVVLAEDGPLVGRLGRAGVSSEVLPMAEQARDVHRAELGGSRLPMATLLASVRYTFRLTRRLRRLRPDIIHINSLKAGFYGGVAGRLAGIPVVWQGTDRIADDYLPGPAVRLTRFAARWLPAAVIANSAETLSTLPPGRRRGRLDRVVANAYRPMRPAPPPRVATDRALRVGMVGRLAPWKGQHVAIEAFARAFPDGEERLILVGGALFGEDDYESRLRKDIARLGIEDRVDLVGPVDDVEAQLAGMDVLVHASTSPEPFGQVVVEGMAAGLAVIATAAGGPAEIICNRTDGLLVAPGDVGAMRDALRDLAGDAELRRRLGQAAQVSAGAYEPEIIARSVRDVYDDVLAARSTGGDGRRQGYRPRRP